MLDNIERVVDELGQLLSSWVDASAHVQVICVSRKKLDINVEHVTTVEPLSLLEAIESRDAKDRNRSASPLRPAEDAVVIDSTELSADQVFERAMALITSRGIV